MVTRPSRTAAIAGAASGAIFTHHCFITNGSSTVLQRSCTATACVSGSSFTRRPRSFSISTAIRRPVSRSGPASGPAAGVIAPRVSMTVVTGRPWGWPVSKSLASDVWPPALVVRMHGHGDVPDDRFRARGRDDERRIARLRVRPRIAHEVERVGTLDMLHLEIGVRRLTAQAPVHDAVGAVEVAALV